jgi:hypothetical protein
MATVTVRVLTAGTRVRIRHERGRFIVIGSYWQHGREVDDLLRVDNGPGAFRTVTRDRLVVLRSTRA